MVLALILKLRLWATGTLLVLLVACSARAQEAPTPPPAAPSTTDSKDNSAPRSTKSTYQQIKEDLFGPPQHTDLKSSIDRLMNPAQDNNRPFQMPKADSKTREQREQRDQWMFDDMNALNSPFTLEDDSSFLDPTAKDADGKKLSPMEKYYQDLGKKPVPGSNTVSRMLMEAWTTRQYSGTNSFDSLSLAMPGLDYLLKAMQPGSNSVFGKDDNAATDDPAAGAAFESKADQKQRSEAFKHILNHDSPAQPLAGPDTVFAPFSDLLKFGAPASPAFATPASSAFGTPAMPGVFSPTPSAAPASVSGFRPAAQNSGISPAFSPAITTRSAAPSVAPSSKPVALDPFKENMPKRSF